MSQSDVMFEEKQKFTQLWLWAVFALEAVTAIAIVAKVKMPQGVSIPLLVTFLGLPVLFLTWTMRTEVREDALYIRFWPVKRGIPFSEIKSAEARTYSPIGEYGGWGFRYGRNGKAYNMSGNRGVQLELKSGERILIGSQKADDLEAAIKLQMRNVS